MKKILTITAVFVTALALTGCQKDGTVFGNNDDICALTVYVGDESAVNTKIAGAVADDNIIRDVQILVFRKEATDEESKIDAAVRISGLNAEDAYTVTETLNCTRGPREIWVVANAASDYITGTEAVLTLKDLKAKTTVLNDNHYGTINKSFVMAGNKVVDLNAAFQSVSVDVKRMACKIVVKSIEDKLTLPVYQAAGSLKITGAYLMSVAGCQKFDNLNTVSTARTFFPASGIPANCWYGKNVKDANALITEDYTPVKALEYNGKLNDVSTFYAYPNDAAPSSESMWSVRGTILVIAATIKGDVCYYPVQLPDLESNKCYEVSLVIRHRGSEDPWRPVEYDDLTTTVNVIPWTPVSIPSEI